MDTPRLRILGLDPGSRHTGYGVVERLRDGRLEALAHGRISCPTRLPLADRLVRLTSELEQVLADWRPSVTAVEAVFQGLNPRSLIVLAQARGALLAVVARNSLAIREYAPAVVKVALTGHGRADKEQIARMVKLVLRLGPDALSQDVTDALAVAVCCAQREAFDRLTRHP